MTKLIEIKTPQLALIKKEAKKINMKVKPFIEQIIKQWFESEEAKNLKNKL